MRGKSGWLLSGVESSKMQRRDTRHTRKRCLLLYITCRLGDIICWKKFIVLTDDLANKFFQSQKKSPIQAHRIAFLEEYDLILQHGTGCS